MVNRSRPMTQAEMNRQEDVVYYRIHNRSKQMLPIHFKAGTSTDFFVNEQSIKLIPGKTSVPIPEGRLNMAQVRNLEKKGMIRLTKS